MSERITTAEAERQLGLMALMGMRQPGWTEALLDLLDARRERDEARAELERERVRPPRRE